MNPLIPLASVFALLLAARFLSERRRPRPIFVRVRRGR